MLNSRTPGAPPSGPGPFPQTTGGHLGPPAANWDAGGDSGGRGGPGATGPPLFLRPTPPRALWPAREGPLPRYPGPGFLGRIRILLPVRKGKCTCCFALRDRPPFSWFPLSLPLGNFPIFSPSPVSVVVSTPGPLGSSLPGGRPPGPRRELPCKPSPFGPERPPSWGDVPGGRLKPRCGFHQPFFRLCGPPRVPGTRGPGVVLGAPPDLRNGPRDTPGGEQRGTPPSPRGPRARGPTNRPIGKREEGYALWFGPAKRSPPPAGEIEGMGPVAPFSPGPHHGPPGAPVVWEA